MGDRFGLAELGAVDVEGPFLSAKGTGSSAVGAGLLVAEGVGLLLEERLDGAFGEAGSGGAGDLFHGIKIDVESGAVAEGAAGDDSAPLGREGADIVELGGGQRAACHTASSLGVGTRPGVKMAPLNL